MKLSKVDVAAGKIPIVRSDGGVNAPPEEQNAQFGMKDGGFLNEPYRFGEHRCGPYGSTRRRLRPPRLRRLGARASVAVFGVVA